MLKFFFLLAMVVSFEVVDSVKWCYAKDGKKEDCKHVHMTKSCYYTKDDDGKITPQGCSSSTEVECYKGNDGKLHCGCKTDLCNDSGKKRQGWLMIVTCVVAAFLANY